jgi:hypothetical protein
MSRSGLALRIAGSALVAGILLVLFLLGRDDQPPAGPAAPDPKERLATIARLDTGIDSVLAGFDVAPASVKKRSYEIAAEGFTRTERLVAIPDSVVPVSVNAALNAMALRSGARAVASENLRLHIVTIHLELDGRIVHTIILKKITRKTPRGGRQPRVST